MKRLAFYNLNYVVLMVFFVLPLSIAIAIDNENLCKNTDSVLNEEVTMETNYLS
ncbi:hypothetical protein BANRA_02235 [Escherichia coli]|nr:hypothetical protein BANRA_02235 [Escherichia coli]